VSAEDRMENTAIVTVRQEVGRELREYAVLVVYLYTSVS
jgi:hypothetical protein